MVSPQGIREVDVEVDHGIIVRVDSGIEEIEGMQVLDIKGKYILPGLIDMHVHFRTPGMTQKEDWKTGSQAALAGGVTTVIDMPNTVPATIDQVTFEEKRALVAEQSLVHYGFYVGATERNLDEIKAMVSRGEKVRGIKIYMGSSTGDLLINNDEVLERFFKEAPCLLLLHAEADDCISEGVKHFSDTSNPAVHSKIRDPKCALLAVQKALSFAKKYGTQIHFCHVSTGAELDLIREAALPNVTVEVTPHHLFMNTKDYDTYGNLIKVNPPIRAEEDMDALWKGIVDGVVNIVATDHAPHLFEEKDQDVYAKVPSGVPGVQTMLPLLLTAVNDQHISLQKVVELSSFAPAQRLGLGKKGKIEVGMDADLVIVDLNLFEKVCHHYLWSKCGWSPFHGWILKGWPVMTFVQGNLMYSFRNSFGDVLGKEV